MLESVKDRITGHPLGLEFLLGRVAMVATLAIFVVRQAPGFQFLPADAQITLLVVSGVFIGSWAWFWFRIAGRTEGWKPALAIVLTLVSATMIVWERPSGLYPFYYVVVLAGAAYAWRTGIVLATLTTLYSLGVWWFSGLAAPWTLQGVVVIGLLAGASVLMRRYVGIQLELTEARDEVRRLATAETRAQFARDLHDQLGQDLTVAVIHGELLNQDLAEKGDSEAAERADRIVRSSRDALRIMREMATQLRTPDLRDEVALARQVLTQSGINVTVDVPATDLDPLLNQTLGWVVREAATNTLRHSTASACSITLTPSDDGVVLRIDDNGAVPTIGEAGNGLSGLQERVNAVSGSLTSRAEASGFTIEARLPRIAGDVQP